ncbi:lysozyme-like [Amyelois transitella]|uniref:lysozyme-like n=1 Tax=Amyelois transitella TaxID=680683 RepID=UPI00298FC1CE|nr:lysozyme-like [Amyelois transitella]
MRLILLSVIVAYSVKYNLTKNFTRCDLVKELRYQGFPEEQLRTWVCLVEAESSRRSDVIGGPDDDGSYDFGLFQINDRYWCSTGVNPGKGCNVLCKDLLTDNITKASLCAMKIYKQQGFSAWLGWKNECYSQTLPNLRKCNV